MMLILPKGGHIKTEKVKLSIISLCKDNLIKELDQLFSSFDNACSKTKHFRSFVSGGCTFNFYSNQADYLSLIDRALQPNNSKPLLPATILSTNFGDLGLPHFKWIETTLDAVALDSMLKNTPYRLHIDSQYQVYSIFDRKLSRGIQLRHSSSQKPPWETGGPLRIFIHWHLAKLSRPLIHAGSLAVGNTGVLIAGPGGSGKSSTVISGIFSELGSVGDDYISVEINSQILLRPVFKIMKVDPARLLAIGIKTTADLNWQNKVELNFSELSRGLTNNLIEAKALLLPKICNRKKSRLLRASSKQAFLSLTPSAMSQLPGDWDHLFRSGAEISRRLPCYVLELGVDPKEIAVCIKSFITQELL